MGLIQVCEDVTNITSIFAGEGRGRFARGYYGMDIRILICTKFIIRGSDCCIVLVWSFI